MNCPSCGKEVPAGSQFCLNCGKPLSTTASPSMGTLQWEYKYVLFPPDTTIPEMYKREKPPYATLGSSYTVATALNEFWVSMERDVHEAIKDEVEQGWEPDPNGWGPSCIEYRTRKVGTDYWSGGQWVGYIIFGLVSYGLLLLVLPFTWKADILEPVRLKVRLRRLKR